MRRERLTRTNGSEDFKEPQARGEKSLSDLEEGLSIDEHALDEALIAQPGSYYDVGKSLALAISRRDAAKQELQVAEARADSSIRESATAEGRKITEASILQEIKLDDDVIKARKVLSNREEEVAIFSALRDAFSQRQYALRDLVSLYLASYYSKDGEGRGGDVANFNAQVAKRKMSEARNKRD